MDDSTPVPRPPIELEDDPREEETPRDRPPIPLGHPSDTKLRMARAAAILNAFATKLGTSGGILDGLGPSERALFVRRIAGAGRKHAAALSALMDDIERAE